MRRNHRHVKGIDPFSSIGSSSFYHFPFTFYPDGAAIISAARLALSKVEGLAWKNSQPNVLTIGDHNEQLFKLYEIAKAVETVNDELSHNIPDFSHMKFKYSAGDVSQFIYAVRSGEINSKQPLLVITKTGQAHIPLYYLDSSGTAIHFSMDQIPRSTNGIYFPIDRIEQIVWIPDQALAANSGKNAHDAAEKIIMNGARVAILAGEKIVGFEALKARAATQTTTGAPAPSNDGARLADEKPDSGLRITDNRFGIAGPSSTIYNPLSNIRLEELRLVGSRIAVSLGRMRSAIIPIFAGGAIVVYSFVSDDLAGANNEGIIFSPNEIHYTVRQYDPYYFETFHTVDPNHSQKVSTGRVNLQEALNERKISVGSRLTQHPVLIPVSNTSISYLELWQLRKEFSRIIPAEVAKDAGFVGFRAITEVRNKEDERVPQAFLNLTRVFGTVPSGEAGVMAVNYDSWFDKNGDLLPSDIYKAVLALNRTSELLNVRNLTVAVYGPEIVRSRVSQAIERLHLIAPRIQFVFAALEESELFHGLTPAVKNAVAKSLGVDSRVVSLIGIAYPEKFKGALAAEDKIFYAQVAEAQEGNYISAMLLLLGFSLDAGHIPPSLAGYLSVVSIVSNGRTFKVFLVRPIPLTNAVLDLYQISLTETSKSA